LESIQSNDFVQETSANFRRKAGLKWMQYSAET